MPVTAEEVRKYRDDNGVGMDEAKRTLERRDIKQRLLRLRNGLHYDLQPVDLKDLIDIIIEMEGL